MRKIDRFLQYLEYNAISENKATTECGLSQGLIHQAKSGKSDLGTKSIDKILIKYQDLNRDWLLTGRGEMLKSNMTESETISIDRSILRTIISQQETIHSQQKMLEKLINANDQKKCPPGRSCRMCRCHWSIIDNILCKNTKL